MDEIAYPAEVREVSADYGADPVIVKVSITAGNLVLIVVDEYRSGWESQVGVDPFQSLGG